MGHRPGREPFYTIQKIQITTKTKQARASTTGAAPTKTENRRAHRNLRETAKDEEKPQRER